MEVRHEKVDDLPFEATVDEERGVARQRPARGGLERADSRGSHGNDPTR